MNARTSMIRNTLFSSVGLYTEYVLGMLTAIVIARHLAPEGYGAYSLVIWLVGMGVATTNSGTASAMIKFIAELRGSGREHLVPKLIAFLRRAQHAFLACVMVAGAAVFVFAGDRIAPGMNHLLLLAFLEIAVVLRSSYMLNIGIAKGHEDFRATAIVALVSTPLNLLMVLAAWWLDASAEWLLGIFVLSSVVFYVASLRQVRRLVPPGPVSSEPLPGVLVARIKRHMLLTALIVTISFFVASEVEVLFLNLFSEADAAGRFKVAFQLATGAALLVPGVFGAILLPMMANALSRGQAIAGRRFVASTNYLALLALPLVAFGVVFSADIIGLLYGEAYAAAAPVFAMCLAGTAISTMTQGGSSLLVSADRQASILLRVIACGLIKIALDIVLIMHLGLVGAGIAYLSGSLVAAGTTMALAIRVGRIGPDWKRLGRIALSALVAGAIVSPLHGRLTPIAAILVGGVLLAGIYAGVTLLLGCWTRGDVDYLKMLHQRYARGFPGFGIRFLDWAHARAPQEIP